MEGLRPKPRFESVGDGLVLQPALAVHSLGAMVPGRQPWPARLLHSAGRVLNHRLGIRVPFQEADAYADRESLGHRLTRQIITQMAKIAKTHGARFVTMPLLSEADTLGPYRPPVAVFFEELARDLAGYNIDIWPIFRSLSVNDRRRCYITGDGHYSRFGHCVIASQLFSQSVIENI